MSSMMQTSTQTDEGKRGNKSDKNSGDKKTVENCTGLHVFQYAAASVLGARVTTSVKFESATKVVATIECGNVDEKQKEDLMVAANALIAADRKCFEDMECQGPHCAHAGDIKGLFLQKTKFRKKQGVVEFQFIIGDAALASLSGSKKLPGGGPKTEPGAVLSKAAAASKGQESGKIVQTRTPRQTESKSGSTQMKNCGGRNQVLQTVDDVISEVLAAMEPPLSGDAEQRLRERLEPRLQSILNGLQNAAYTQGFASRTLPVTKLWGVHGEAYMHGHEKFTVAWLKPLSPSLTFKDYDAHCRTTWLQTDAHAQIFV
eukprot:g27842.t1